MRAKLLGHYGSDQLIAEEAWESSGVTDGDGTSLIKKLVALKHRKPLEIMHFHFKLFSVPISIDRQFQTHRNQEASVATSGRYGSTPLEFSAPWDNIPEISEEDKQFCNKHVQNDKEIYEAKCEIYGPIIGKRRAREVFRDLLPQGQLMNRRLMLNLVAFAGLMRQRLKPSAQLEAQQLAELMLKAVKEANVCPEAIKALEECEWKPAATQT